MDKKSNNITPDTQEVQVTVPPQLRAPAYANFVNVSASEGEVTLNFVYVNSQENPAGTLVSRVVMPRNMLGKMVDLLIDVAEAAGRSGNEGH